MWSWLSLRQTFKLQLVRVDSVGDTESGAHVALGVGSELDPLHDSCLPRGVVEGVQGIVSQGRVSLPVATNIALGKGHAVGVDYHLWHSTH